MISPEKTSPPRDTHLDAGRWSPPFGHALDLALLLARAVGLDREDAAQGAPAAEGLWRSLGLGRGLVCGLLPRLLPHSRWHAAQQEVEVVAVVKDHWDGLGRLGSDVAGVRSARDTAPAP